MQYFHFEYSDLYVTILNLVIKKKTIITMIKYLSWKIISNKLCVSVVQFISVLSKLVSQYIIDIYYIM